MLMPAMAMALGAAVLCALLPPTVLAQNPADCPPPPPPITYGEYVPPAHPWGQGPEGHCHDSPLVGWESSGIADHCSRMSNDCASTCPYARFPSPSYDWESNAYDGDADGALPTEACCGCGGGSNEPFRSCATPEGRSWSEDPVDCAAAGRMSLAHFDAPLECEGRTCGLEDCCAPLHCHDQTGWISVGWTGDGSDAHRCDYILRENLCATPDRHTWSADGVSPAAACCACGGGSTDLLPSCATPTGRSWDETPVDCAAAGRIPRDSLPGPGECAGAVCGLDDCCRPADWAPACTGDDLQALLAQEQEAIATGCMACIGEHHSSVEAIGYCVPTPTRTACSAAEATLDINDADDINPSISGELSGDCLGCIIAAGKRPWKQLCAPAPAVCSAFIEYFTTASATCCADPDAPCVGGLPTSTCTADCAEILVAMQTECTDFLQQLGIHTVVEAAVATCESNGSGGSGH